MMSIATLLAASCNSVPHKVIGSLGHHSRKHSRSIGLAAQYPNNITIQTSLYRYPSNSSLAPHCTQDSSHEPSLVDTTQVFTAVIPPLAGIPPTGPLPPTPPLEVTDLGYNIVKVLAGPGLKVIDKDGKSKMKTAGKTKTVGAVIGVITDHSGDEHVKRSLRRVKGNVGEVATKYKEDVFKSSTTCQRRESKGMVKRSSGEHGLPTPGSTPPTTTSPKLLHRASASGLASSIVEDNNWHDDSSDDEDGGILLDYDEVDKVEHEDWLNSSNRNAVKAEGLSTLDVPLPDSPSVIGFAFHLDEDEGREEKPMVDEQGITTICLQTCKKSQPEFTTPARVGLEKAKIMSADSQYSSNNGTGIAKIMRPKIPIRRSTNSTTESVLGGVALELVSEKSCQRGAVIKTSVREHEKTLHEVDERIKQSSIVKRRLATLGGANTEKKAAFSNLPNAEKAKTPMETGVISKNPQEFIEHSNDLESPKPPTGQNELIQISRATLAPPSLPRFNFIPPTPLTLNTPITLRGRELGESQYILPNPDENGTSHEAVLRRRTSSRPGTRSSSWARPPLTSQTSRLRDSKLHPWWKPRSYWQDEQYDLAKVLSDTETFVESQNSKTGSRFSEALRTEDEEASLESKDKRRRWSGGGLGSMVRVVKKRRVLSLGKVEIEFVGIDRLVAKFTKSSASPKLQKKDN